VSLAVLGAVLSLGCAAGQPAPAPAHAEASAALLTLNETYHVVHPCEEHALAPARVLLEVAIDAQGQARGARVTRIGGTVRKAFETCAQTRLLAETYATRGKPATLSAMVDLRVGPLSNAGNSTPVPWFY
jgi:hypothetical protein